MISKDKNILLVSQHDHKGGAARIAWYLFEGFRKRGYPTHFAAGKKSLNDPDISEIDHSKYMNPAIFWKAKKWLDLYQGIENFNFPGTSHIPDYHPSKPDIIHTHNLQGKYFDLRKLPNITAKFPTLVTLHDPWMFSGHCSYFIDCPRWKTGCGKCPDLERTPSVKRDATAYNWKRKKNIYEQSKLFIAAPSQWLIDELKHSMLMPSALDARVVNNGVDASVYQPTDQNAIRKEKGIPEDAFVLLYVVSSRMKVNKYKDYETVQKAVSLLQGQLPEHKKVIFLGLGTDGETEVKGNIEKRFIPYQTDLHEIAKYYQLSDLYLHAARAENFPNVILEALACGTPVIGTNTGGIAEQIIENKTGHVVPYRGAKEMAEKILKVMQHPNHLVQMSAEAAADVQRRFTLNHMMDAYLDYYEEILMQWQPNNQYTKTQVTIHE